MKITTDYRKEINPDTFSGGTVSEYRLMMYFCDVVRNFFSDSVNIKDERLLTLLGSPDSDRYIGKNITVDPPFKPDMRESCTTPCVRVGIGELTLPVEVLDNPFDAISPAGWRSSGQKMITESLPIQIAILTESYAGTVLLSSLLKDFLMVNTLNMIRDCKMLNGLRVAGASAPEHITIGNAGNAKDVFQRVITLATIGTYSYVTDTQGPVFKGLQVTNSAK